MGKIRVLEISGTPREMGRQHGQAYAEDIRRLAEERVRLSSDPIWTGVRLPRERVLALAEECLAAHEIYAPELVEELRGMADATELSLPELIILNGFTDFTDTLYALKYVESSSAGVEMQAHGCTAFIVGDDAALDGHGFYGQTWDMHASATPYVTLLHLHPLDAPAVLVFTITGCVGMLGMNAAGIAIGINMLMATDGRTGVTWPFVVRKALAQTNIDAALECITSAKLAGAHNYMLFDKEGRGFNVEAMAQRFTVTELDGAALAHTNHCLADYTRAVEQERDPNLQANSEARLAAAYEALSAGSITPETLMALTRDRGAICRSADPVYHVETCGATIMRPYSGDFWAVWGLPHENEYEHFSI